MKGLWIDPDTQTIEELDRDFSDIKNIQDVVEGHFTIACFIDGNVVYCDDEGMLKVNLAYTEIDGAYAPFAGHLLVLGDKDGSATDVTITGEELGKKIRFLTHQQVKEKYARH